MKPTIADMVLEIMGRIGFPVLETDLARMIPEMYPGRMALPSSISRELRKLAETDKVASRYRVVAGEKKNYKEWYLATLLTVKMIEDGINICKNAQTIRDAEAAAVPKPAQPPHPDAVQMQYAEYQKINTSFTGVPWDYFKKVYGHLVADEEKQLVWA